MTTNQATCSGVQEYQIRVPKNPKKKHHVMRFNSNLNVEFSKWNQVKMERENNLKEFKGIDEDMPKYGAGSEFGREQREEARRKKHGIIARSYRVEDQPWILKVGGKMGKKFKGIREGGVSENAAFYIFTHAPDGAIEAFSLDEWYNFQPIQRYKALSAEEAEEEFGRRNKVMNYFSFMMRRRLRNEDEADGEDGEEGIGKGKSSGKGKGKGKAAKGDLTISEMDEWVDSDEDDSDSENENKEEEDEKPKKKGKKGQEATKKKKKKHSDDEAFEESDDGDEEGREVDYISDSSDSVSDHEEKAGKEMKGVAEEDALRKLLTSDEEEEEEEKKVESEVEDNKENSPSREKEEKKQKDKKKQKKKKKEETKESSTDYSSSSSDSENEATKKNGKNKESSSATNSRSATPVVPENSEDRKRGASDGQGSESTPSKRPRLENFSSAASSGYLPYGAAESGITEDAVRRYLMRKPMSTTELLQKFKSKKTGLTSDQLVNVMTQILKKINPVQQTIKGKMYLSLKS